MAARQPRSTRLLALGAASACLLLRAPALDFLVLRPGAARTAQTGMHSGKEVRRSGKVLPPYGVRDPLPKGYGIRTGLSDLLKPLNSQVGVTAKTDDPPTYLVMVAAIVFLFLFYTLLLLINNQTVLLPPEDEFDEYVSNFVPYFFFGEK